MAASKSSSRGPLWSSTIGLKVLMALTGLAMVGFLLGHMAGHLQVFAGRDAYNAYAKFLQGLGGLLWGARLGLLGAIALHVFAALKLNARNKDARPEPYAVKTNRATTPYAISMLYSGYTILAFVGYHIAHFTLGVVHTPIETYGPADDLVHDVFAKYVVDFQNPVIFLLYAAAMVGIAMHLSHAVSSVFRTLGVMRGKYREPLSKVGPIVGYVTAIGFLIPPAACLLGIVTV
ncbi:MAG: succinate dehydrogenase cytochrome b subunit [Nannocystaceae bacterium]|nr:succinate dehydrogenase cytochrome b subunit [Nannocystaceae bacterium]